MPIEEIPYRLNQAARKRIDKYFPANCRLVSKDKADSILLSQFREDLWHTRTLPNLLPLDKKLLIREAENILSHDFEIFGIRRNFGDPINFHLDPKTLRTWPLKFWGDIHYRNGQKVGGIKFAWELNRLHHFPKLGLAYSIALDRRYLCELFK